MTDQDAGPRLTRRRALGLVGAGVVGVAGAGSLGGYAVGRPHERRRVQKHGDVSPDEHEFTITPRGTAYIVSHVRTKADLRPVQGPEDGLIMNGIFEEVDLATGEVLHHWESLDHVALTESHAGVPEDPTEPYDYFHINSVAPTPDGNVIISARHTWAVYKVDLQTGAVRLRPGRDREVRVAARRPARGPAHPPDLRQRQRRRGHVTDESQVLWFSVDEAGREARLVRRLVHPAKISAHAMGNAQRLDNGNLFVGWGGRQLPCLPAGLGMIFIVLSGSGAAVRDTPCSLTTPRVHLSFT